MRALLAVLSLMLVVTMVAPMASAECDLWTKRILFTTFGGIGIELAPSEWPVAVTASPVGAIFAYRIEEYDGIHARLGFSVNSKRIRPSVTFVRPLGGGHDARLGLADGRVIVGIGIEF